MSTSMKKKNMMSGFDDNTTEALLPVESNCAIKGFGRRDFLKGAGVLVVGFSLSAATRLVTGGSTVEAAETAGTASLLADLPNDQVDSYIVIAQDGTTTLFTSRVDMGQGTGTGFMQIMAEELDIAFSKARAVMGNTVDAANDGGTSGSSGIQEHGLKVRQAAATARAALLSMASARLGVPVSQLKVNEGVVSVVGDPTKSVTYAQLIAGRRFDVKIDSKIKTKPVDQYKIVGQSIPRVNIPGMLTGELEYVHDVRLPGMLHARAVRPRGQSLDYSKLLSYDESSVAGVKGLVKVVPGISTGDRGDQLPFVGVICEREEQATEAARKLKVTWETPPPINPDLYDLNPAHSTLFGRPRSLVDGRLKHVFDFQEFLTFG